MAVILQMTYMKKLGLPNYSSHSCAASLTVEIADVSVAAQESTKLYALLQTAVDNEIQQVGFMPDATTYGMNNGNGSRITSGNGNTNANGSVARNGNGHSNGNGYANGNGRHAAPAPSNGDHWNCTDGQKGFILRIIAESSLTKQDVEEMAQQLFGAGVTSLDKMQASQLIEELLEKTGKKAGGPQRRWSRQPART
jgi:hypothetical protein